ncbi:hypothetical protein K1X76_10060 [bacterium]|nr:hypothetical protein [bacterium]
MSENKSHFLKSSLKLTLVTIFIINTVVSFAFIFLVLNGDIYIKNMPLEVLNVKRINMLDNEGSIRAVLGMHSSDVATMPSLPSLGFFDKNGMSLMSLTGSSFSLRNIGNQWKEGKQEYEGPFLNLEPKGVSLYDTNGMDRLSILIDNDEPSIQLLDETGKILTSIGVINLIAEDGTKSTTPESSLIFFRKKDGTVIRQYP